MRFKVIPRWALTEKVRERFLGKVDRRGPEECWLWTGSTTKAKYGAVYGAFHTDGLGGRLKPPRVAYVLSKGEIPEGLTIDHLCGVRLCCNPAHLEAVTISVNVRRYLATRPERAKWAKCACGNQRRAGGRDRRCLECFNKWYREYRERNPEKIRAIVKASYERIGRKTRQERMKAV